MTTSTASPSAAQALTIDSTGSASFSWSLSGGATSVQAADSSNAQCAMSSPGKSYTLRARGFGFAIPTGATINGIELDMIGSTTLSIQNTGEVVVQLVSGVGTTLSQRIGTSQGIRADATGYWPTTQGTMVRGGSSNLWGATLSSTVINDTNFGVDIQVEFISGSTRTFTLDQLVMKVFYTANPTGTLGLTEVGDTAILTATCIATAIIVIVESNDILSTASAARAAASLGLVEIADGFAGAAISTITSSLTISELGDIFQAAAREYIQTYAGRNANLVEKATPTVNLIEKAKSSVGV